jgi:putative DNA primase/helicase
MNNSDQVNVRGTILEVPFSEKDEVKELGARWDPEMRKWFVPKGINTEPFEKWFGQQTNE